MNDLVHILPLIMLQYTHTDTVTELLYTKVKVFVYPFPKRLNNNQKPSTQLQLSEEHHMIRTFIHILTFWYDILVSVALGGMELMKWLGSGNGICLFGVCSQWSRISKQFKVSHILTCSGLALSAVKALLLDKYRASESLLSVSRLLQVLWLGSTLDSRSTPLPLCGQTKRLSHLNAGEKPCNPLNNIPDCGVTGSLLAPMAHFKVRVFLERL